nr:LCP family protein [Gordonia sp. NB41Y]
MRAADDAAYRPPQAWSATGPGVPGYAPPQKPQPIPAGPEPRGRTQARSAAPASPRPAGPTAPPPRDTPPTPDRGRRRRRSGPRRPRRRRIGRHPAGGAAPARRHPDRLMFYYDSKLDRIDALATYAGRPAASPGTTWLIVGTDSRAGLTDEQKRDLATGDSDGARTDTIMLVYKPPSGDPAIISIPRDLYVPIPGNGEHKINAAFGIGGAPLLVQTVEELSGMRLDHYAEIGFGGFDSLVDAIGGVDICVDAPMRDPKAGLNLKAGCQTLNGQQALGFVRTRDFPNADLQRVQNQRKFLAALMSKATGFSVLLNPFRLFPFVNGVVDTLVVDNGTHIWNLASLAWALRSSPQTVTTPNGGDIYTDDGDSLAVGDNTKEFFDAIRRGQPIPDHLLDSTPN